jgi:hypothetical protein
MPDAVYQTRMLIERLVGRVVVGTNRGLLQLFWAMVSGALLGRRGALFPALQQVGLSEREVRRAWAALGQGRWRISALLRRWEQIVTAAGAWQPRRHGGYQALAVDVTAVYRPRLRGCATTHFHSGAGRALPAIPVGIVARTGQAGTQRLGLPVAFVRADPADPSARAHQQALLATAATVCGPRDVVVVDRGFRVRHLQAAGVERYVVRLVKSFTARRATPPPYRGRGRRPTRGMVVRPLARPRRRGGGVRAASVPDRVEQWRVGETVVRAEGWDDLVTADAAPGAGRFTVWAIHDPRYREPLLVATRLATPARVVQQLYLDRWPVEQLPLVAKQLIGAGRQFVHAPETCQRLPELALLAGALLSYAAATGPLLPTGCWDRRPARTPGRLRRVLARHPFPHDVPLPARIRRKAAATSHLRTGAARWRVRAPAPPASPAAESG